MNFHPCIDMGEVKAIKESFFIKQMATCISIDSRKMTLHVTNSICSYIQGRKHHKYLQDRHNWSQKILKSIDWKGLKSGYLLPGPLK
jgi:hypothetical protein